MGQTEKEIDGKLSHISIFYHPPGVKEEAEKYDSCSHEGQWTFKEDGKGNLIAQTLQKLQAVAFLKRGETPPALSGALKLGVLQAVDKPGKGDDLTPPGKGKEYEMIDLNTLTFEQIAKAVKDKNIFPSQLFSLDVIQRDNGFNDFFNETNEIKKKSAELQTQVETLSNEKTALSLEKEKANFKPRFKSIVEEKKLTPKMKTFLEKKFEKTQFETFTDENINQFIMDNTKEFTEFASIFTDKTETPIPLGNPTPPGGSNQPENGTMFDKLPDMNDPSKNPIFNGIDLKGITE